MREILFRGKRIRPDNDTGITEWVYGHYMTVYGVPNIELDDGRECDVDEETVGQYTGRCDKNGNGKKIYEGDIVTGLFDFGVSINAVIAFRDGAFGLLAKQHGVEHFHPFTSLCNVEYEVIGNIHDNPELLKESDKE